MRIAPSQAGDASRSRQVSSQRWPSRRLRQERISALYEGKGVSSDLPPLFEARAPRQASFDDS
jgi:hypothetical protein